MAVLAYRPYNYVKITLQKLQSRSELLNDRLHVYYTFAPCFVSITFSVDVAASWEYLRVEDGYGENGGNHVVPT
jgi:hypothetical protein